MTCETFSPVPLLRRELFHELQLGGLRLTESWHTASSTIPWHAHRWATVTILLDGSFEESYRLHRQVECDSPSVHIRPPGEMHQDRLGTIGAHNLVLEVDDDRLESIRDHSTLFDEIRHLEDPRLLALGRRMRAEWEIRDAASALSLEGLALELLGSVSRRTRRDRGMPAWLLEARDLLHDRFRDQDLRMADLAEAVDVHPVHLSRTFRRHFQDSPGEYLRRLRIEWAADEIRRSKRPLTEIADAAGFSDQSHLSRVFKRVMGCSPGAWRRRHL